MSWSCSTELVPRPTVQLRTTTWSEVRGKWTAEENKIFENALAIHDTDTADRWIRVAEHLPGKSVEEVRRHYRELVEDVSHIEAGLVPLPGYTSSAFTLEWAKNQQPGGERVRSPSDHERKKGIPWTEDEHRQFLIGLKKYGKGDWKSISRNFVITRTPTQVASHAQKYFLRRGSGGKDKRRSSIHDITTASVPDGDKLPSSPSMLPMSPSSVPHEAPMRHFAVAMDSKQVRDPSTVLSTEAAATRANNSLYMMPRPSPQDIKIHKIGDSTLLPLQAACCRPHVW